MPDALPPAEYERLADAELDAADAADDARARKDHLNQAAIYAHYAEQGRKAWLGWVAAA